MIRSRVVRANINKPSVHTCIHTKHMAYTKLDATFKGLDSDETFVGTPQTEFALNSVLGTLPRELIQNTYDARETGEKPKINFFFECLEGSELQDFKTAIDWKQLRPHLEAVAENDEKLGVQKALDQIDEGELYILGIEDTHAVGLDGDDDSRDTNYADLVKDFASSGKKEGGGIHGVGASVLWAFSGFKLVLFHSLAASETDSKLVGRLDLPDHVLGGQEYKGGGWLGVDDGSHDRSVALRPVPRDLAETLRLDRTGENGTTSLVVGFRERTRATREPEDIVDAIYEAAARYYWPLIVDDGIEVTVEGPNDSTPREVDPMSVPRVSPYVQAYDAWQNPDDDFGDPGTVAVEEIEFEVPPTDSEPAITGELVLVVRLVDEDNLEKYRNKVAMFRGPRHVVKYRNYGSASRTTGKDFHALLLTGGAKHPPGLKAEDIPDQGDQAIEFFFRDAEPEAHDTWEEPTPRLANAYDDENPSKRIVSFLKTTVKKELQQILGGAQTDDDERVKNLGEEFPFFEDDHGTSGKRNGGGGGGGNLPFDVVQLDSWFDGAHRYQGEIELDTQPENNWTLTISIDEVDGSNKTIDQIDIDRGSSPDDPAPAVRDGEITYEFTKHTTRTTFELSSVAIGDEILAGRTRLDFEYDLSPGGQP